MSLLQIARQLARYCEHLPEHRERLLELPPTAQDGDERTIVGSPARVVIICSQCGARRIRGGEEPGAWRRLPLVEQLGDAADVFGRGPSRLDGLVEQAMWLGYLVGEAAVLEPESEGRALRAVVEGDLAELPDGYAAIRARFGERSREWCAIYTGETKDESASWTIPEWYLDPPAATAPMQWGPGSVDPNHDPVTFAPRLQGGTVVRLVRRAGDSRCNVELRATQLEGPTMEKRLEAESLGNTLGRDSRETLEQREREEQLARLFHPWKAGDRARAAMRIVYADGRHPEVEEGHGGIVEAIELSRVLRIRWDGSAASVATSPDSVDPCLSDLDALRVELYRIAEVLDAGGFVDFVRLAHPAALLECRYIVVEGRMGEVSLTPLGREVVASIDVPPVAVTRVGACVHCGASQADHGQPPRLACNMGPLRARRPDFPRPGERWPRFVAAKRGL